MNSYKALEKYIEKCSENLINTQKILNFLKKNGIYEKFIFENFQLGFSSGDIVNKFENPELKSIMTELCILKNKKEVFTNHLIIPITDENRKVINIVGYNISPQAKNRLISLNGKGIFNNIFIGKTDKIFFTANPIDTLSLIHSDFPNATFLFNDNQKYIDFAVQHSTREIVFTFEGKAKLFYELSRKGI